MEVHRGEDDRVQQVRGHDVREGGVVAVHSSEDRSNPIADELKEREGGPKSSQVIPALLLQAGGNRQGRKFPAKPVIPTREAGNCTPVLPLSLGVKPKMIIIAPNCKLSTCKGKSGEGEGAPSRGGLTLEADVLEASRATEFIKMGMKAVGRPIHRALEKDRHRSVQVMFAYPVIGLDLGNVREHRKGEHVMEGRCPGPAEAHFRDEPASLQILRQGCREGIGVGDSWAHLNS
jgi:hypothetical protein